MLRNMRNDFKKYSWTLWLVIIAFILGFSLIDLFSGGKISERVIAKVNGREILIEDYQRQLTQILENYKSRSKGNISKAVINQMHLPEQVLQNLVNSEIILNEASKFNLRTTDNELSKKILNFPVFQRNGKFIGVKEYKRYLAIMKTNSKNFESDLGKDILNDKLKEFVTSGIILNDNLLFEEYKKEKDSADLEYIVLSPEKTELKTPIKDSELKAYYKNNTELFKSPEKRKANIIALKFDDFKKDIKISELKLFKYFKDNKENFLVPERTKVLRILLRYKKENREEILKKAEQLRLQLSTSNFSETAKKISEDDKAQNGGDWGYSDWKKLTTQEQTIIDSLKLNEISGPVDTFEGFAILMTPEKSAERQEPYEKVKERIKSVLEKKELDDLLKSKLNTVFKSVSKKEDISKVFKGTFPKLVKTDFLQSGQAIEGIDPYGYISRKLFTMKKNQTIYPVEFIKGIAIVQLLDIKEPEVEDFLKVKEKVRSALTKVKKLDKLIKNSNVITIKLNNLKNKNDIESYLNKQKLKIDKTTYKRGNNFAGLPTPKDMDNRIFTMDINKFSKPLKLKDKAVIVKVSKKIISSKEDFEQNKKEYHSKKLNEFKNKYFIAFILSKRKNYKIRVNGELFKQIKEKVLQRFN